MPPIEMLQRVPPLALARLERQGIFTTGLLLEVSETRTRRQTLADQINYDTTDVNDWRDEALLLNLASFGPREQALFTQARIIGLSDLLALDADLLRLRLQEAAHLLQQPMPDDVMIEGWWLQAHTLEEE
ncbi:MAG: hypothetical protein QOH61_800 [Chloroflexota bacterium]|jgi:hypothetical protein|nr:hypothetical protein [Chloroflexota bacterium]